MILSCSIDDNPYLQGSLKEFLKLLKFPTSIYIHAIVERFDFPFNASHQDKKRRKERVFIRLIWVPWVVVVLLLFIDIEYLSFS